MDKNPVVPTSEILSSEQCWTVLSATSIGRLVVIVDGRPDVFPVGYKVDGESLIVRTGDGTKLEAIKDDAHVAFEADAVSEESDIAWSVVIKGSAEISTSPEPVLNATVRGLFPWQGVGKDYLVRIVPETVTGKRFTLDSSVTWRASLNAAIRAGLE